MNQMYGFEGEVRAKYSSQMWELFTEIFNWLPLSHLLENRALVMHGGLFSRDGVLLKELVGIDRNRQPPEEGLCVCVCVNFVHVCSPLSPSSLCQV